MNSWNSVAVAAIPAALFLISSLVRREVYINCDRPPRDLRDGRESVLHIARPPIPSNSSTKRNASWALLVMRVLGTLNPRLLAAASCRGFHPAASNASGWLTQSVERLLRSPPKPLEAS